MGLSVLKLRTPERKDANNIYEFGISIMDELAPGREMIEAQLALFPEGNFIAEKAAEDDMAGIAGFVFAVLWDITYEPDFGAIFGKYPHTHASSGKKMFIHTLLVDPSFRRMGLGNKLLGAELNLAALLNVQRVLAVSSTKSLKMYEKLGFTIDRPLPEFLPYHQDRFPQPMLLELVLG